MDRTKESNVEKALERIAEIVTNNGMSRADFITLCARKYDEYAWLIGGI